MFLATKQPRSPGMRSRVYVKFPSLLQTNHVRLHRGFTNRAGRGVSGKRTVFSKGAWAVRRIFHKIILNTKGTSCLGMVAQLKPRDRQTTALALIRTAVGGWYYSPATHAMTPLDYMRSAPISTDLIRDLKAPSHWFWRLDMLRPHTKVSWLASRPSNSASIALAPGSTALMVVSRLWTNWALVILPSGKARLFANQTWCLIGGLAPAFKNYVQLRKASKYRMHGIRPQVRGTVKNPNDHPHGGRTRAIKYPRTPWGRTAKKSRHPRVLEGLRPLLKRTRTVRPAYERPVAHITAASTPLLSFLSK